MPEWLNQLVEQGYAPYIGGGLLVLVLLLRLLAKRLRQPPAAAKPDVLEGVDVSQESPTGEQPSYQQPDDKQRSDKSLGDTPVADHLPEAAPEPPVVEKPKSFVERLRGGVQKSRDWLTGDLLDALGGGKQIDDELLEELETTLLTADVGIEATTRIIDALTKKLGKNQLKDGDALMAALREELLAIVNPCTQPLHITKQGDGPFVLLMVGVNGAGKTTTIGKLARRYKEAGHSVMLAAGDTFRAAAVQQLQTWGERNDVPVIAQGQDADSAAVIFDALESAKAKNVDVVIADTAGRLHTADHLMNELAKIKRVIAKFDATAPHEIMLVVDSVTGQNALSQAVEFNQSVGLTGVTVTKLDGTAKGGVVFAIAHKLGIPIRYIGVGEQAADLGVFNAEEFVDAILGRAGLQAG